MIGLRGQPIPLRADVDDALGESICAHIRLCFDLTFEEGEHAKAAHLRKVLGVQP